MEQPHKHKAIEYRGKIYTVIGWREWVSLPELGITQIKAKIDTGARTSALHAFDIEPFKRQGKDKVHFSVHPIQRDSKTTRRCTAELVDVRSVKSSSAQRELRYVILTTVILGGLERSIEITLTNRAPMIYRMLLGRKALQRYYIIDPARSFHT